MSESINDFMSINDEVDSTLYTNFCEIFSTYTITVQPLERLKAV